MQIDTYKKRTRNQVAKSTLSSRLSALRNLQEFIGTSEEPTVGDVEEWFDHLIDQHEDGEIKASTMRQYLKAVDYYFETIKGETGAVDHIKRYMPANDVDHGEYFEEDEWERALSHATSLVDRLILKLMYYYARRPGEIILLNHEDIEFSDDEDEIGTITFCILKKQDKDLPMLDVDGRTHRVYRATFQLMEEVEPELSEYLQMHDGETETIRLHGGDMGDKEVEQNVTPLFTTSHGRMSYDTLRRRVKETFSDAGVDKNITPKGGRHSRATHLDWSGENPQEIARHQLLHSPSSDVISSYIHDREEDDVRDVMKPGESD